MIATLRIEQSDFTPLIHFNPSENIFEIKGESRPENTGKFYSSVLIWLTEYKEYLQKKSGTQSLVFEFKFDYFNSTSAKFILDLLRKLEDIAGDNPQLNLSIRWHYDELDEDMKDSGEEFSHLVKLPFDFVVH